MLINENNKIFESYTNHLIKEDHEDPDSPLGAYIADMSAVELLDTLKSYNEELYREVEATLEEVQASSTNEDDEIDAGDIGAESEDTSQDSGVEMEDNINY